MGRYAVDPARLEQVDTAVLAGLTVAREAVARVSGEAAALFGTGWHGPAASAYRLAWEQWLEGTGAMLEVLAELAGLLGTSADTYCGTDEAVRMSLARGVG